MRRRRSRHQLRLSLALASAGFSAVVCVLASAEPPLAAYSIGVAAVADGAEITIVRHGCAPTDSRVGRARTCGDNLVSGESLFLVLDNPAIDVRLGTTDSTGSIRLAWAQTEPLFLSGTVPPAGRLHLKSGEFVGDLPLDAARQFWRNKVLLTAQTLIDSDRVEEATEQVIRAANLAPEVSELRGRLDACPTSVERKHQEEEKAKVEVQQHLELARSAIRRDDPDGAAAELDQAEKLGADVNKLREAAAATPTARRRVRAEERRGADEARRQTLDAKRAAAEVMRRCTVERLRRGFRMSCGGYGNLADNDAARRPRDYTWYCACVSRHVDWKKAGHAVMTGLGDQCMIDPVLMGTLLEDDDVVYDCGSPP